MKKDFEWFRYREIIPQLHEIILSALPNAKTNPEQRDLYEAFAAGRRRPGQADPPSGAKAALPDHGLDLLFRRSGQGPVPAERDDAPGRPDARRPDDGRRRKATTMR